MLMEETAKVAHSVAKAALTLPEFRQRLLGAFPASEHPQLRGLLVGVAPNDWRSMALALLGREWTQQRRMHFAAVWVPDSDELDTHEWFDRLGQLGIAVQTAACLAREVRQAFGTTTEARAAADRRSPESPNAIRGPQAVTSASEQNHQMDIDVWHTNPGDRVSASSITTSRRDSSERVVLRTSSTEPGYRNHLQKSFRSVRFETRHRRLRILCREALQRELDLVALGHCLDDEVSILVHRMQHGGFLDGLSALAPSSGPVDSPLRLPRVVRPFWQVPLARLVETCRVSLMNKSGDALGLLDSGAISPETASSAHPSDLDIAAQKHLKIGNDFRDAVSRKSDQPGNTQSLSGEDVPTRTTDSRLWRESPTTVMDSAVASRSANADSLVDTNLIRGQSHSQLRSKASNGIETPLVQTSSDVDQDVMESARCIPAGSAPDYGTLADNYLYLAPVIWALRRHEELLDQEADQLLRQCVEFSSPLGYVVLRPANLAKCALTKEVGLRALLRVLQYVGGRPRTSRTEALERLYDDVTAPMTSMTGHTLMGCLLKPQNSLNRIGAFLHQVRWRQATAGSADLSDALRADQEFYLRQASEAHKPQDPKLESWRKARHAVPSQSSKAQVRQDAGAKHLKKDSSVLDGLHAGAEQEQRDLPAVNRSLNNGTTTKHRQRDLSTDKKKDSKPERTQPDPKLGWYPRFVICREPASSSGRPFAWIPVGRSVLWDHRFLIRIDPENPSKATATSAPSVLPTKAAYSEQGMESTHSKERLDAQQVLDMVKETLYNSPRSETNSPLQASLLNCSPGVVPAPQKGDKNWFRVRQMTLHDWARLTAWRHRLKWTFVPYVCRLGLPVFDDVDGLVAMPHFGYNTRPDVRFTVVYAPVNRTLPFELDRSHVRDVADEVFEDAKGLCHPWQF
ncbi:hypothetical protein CCYA_CCYA01G0401 [Cyanidiococcus yangmingshanensis]|nr:hypothetical protein CCYA_CCYA01G0401 [Cyanidiococcus yangmingshanensis]